MFDTPHIFPQIKHKPLVSTMPDGRVGVFVGPDYAFLSVAQAEALRDALDASIREQKLREGGAA